MKIIRFMTLGLLLSNSLLSYPATKIEGQIYIKISTGEIIKLQHVPVLVIKRSDADRLRKYNLINKLAFLKQELSNADQKTISNREGKFSFTLPPGKYSMAVLAAKTIDGENEVFFWLIDINNEKSMHTISLDNNNLTADFVPERQF